MLYIYFSEDEIPKEYKLIRDVEIETSNIKLNGNEEEKKLLKSIDQAEYIAQEIVKDRFGLPLRVNYLSTGCKAGLCVLKNKDKNKVTDTIECGLNAIWAIVNFCKNGKVLLRNFDIGIADYTNGKPVEICYGKYVFSSIDRLNYYITEELGWCEANLEIEGVYYVSE